MKFLLRPLANFYAWLAHLHRRAYESGFFQRVGVGKPVISIGNLSVGGTGKTPFVLKLIQDLENKNIKAAIVTRSYKGKQKVPCELTVENSKDPAQYGDEACMYKIKNPKFRVFTGIAKYKVAMKAALDKNIQIILVDDGFQHHKLERDWDGVLLDSTRVHDWKPLPEGKLREGFRALSRADAIFLTRTELVEEKLIDEIKKHLPQEKPVFRLKTAFRRLRSFTGNVIEKKLTKVGIVCALGNPHQFEEFFKKYHPDVVTVPFFYGDHHHYTSAEIGFLEAEMARLKLDFLVTTEKDEAKIRKFAAKPHAWASLDIDTEIVEQEAWQKYWDQKINEMVGQSH